jgi:hypothetical protein
MGVKIDENLWKLVENYCGKTRKNAKIFCVKNLALKNFCAQKFLFKKLKTGKF